MMDKFCHACGVKHVDIAYPKTCMACSRITYSNPKPVAVALVPVYDRKNKRTGILIGERGIEPQKGTYGLPGGYVDDKDTSFAGAAAREVFEETGLRVDPNELVPFHSFSDGRNILVFLTMSETISFDTVVKNFEPCDECPAVRVAWEPEDLSFSSHTIAMEKWFDRRAAIERIRGDIGEGLEITGLQTQAVYEAMEIGIKSFVDIASELRAQEREDLKSTAV
jgi:8-oxo-dGTP pyrophosphatase MutT (NUDIX family)